MFSIYKSITNSPNIDILVLLCLVSASLYVLINIASTMICVCLILHECKKLFIKCIITNFYITMIYFITTNSFLLLFFYHLLLYLISITIVSIIYCFYYKQYKQYYCICFQNYSYYLCYYHYYHYCNHYCSTVIIQLSSLLCYHQDLQNLLRLLCATAVSAHYVSFKVVFLYVLYRVYYSYLCNSFM